MWSAPYTLDNVPITGYIIHDDQGTLTDTVNTTEYTLTLSNGDPCNVTTVYVSGINGTNKVLQSLPSMGISQKV